MAAKQNKKTDFKASYPVILRWSLILNLIFIIMLFIAIPSGKKPQTTIDNLPEDLIEIIKTPIVEYKLDEPPKPTRPPVLVEVPEDQLIDTVDYSYSTNLKDYNWSSDLPPLPPIFEKAPVIPYIQHSEDPRPIGGYAAIAKRAIYPQIAVEAGVEGTVNVVAFIDSNGVVQECKVFSGIPNTGLDEAAIAAVEKTKFIPAKQRNRNVGVYVVIPIIFRLQGRP
jgi:protein TonB